MSHEGLDDHCCQAVVATAGRQPSSASHRSGAGLTASAVVSQRVRRGIHRIGRCCASCLQWCLQGRERSDTWGRRRMSKGILWSKVPDTSNEYMHTSCDMWVDARTHAGHSTRIEAVLVGHSSCNGATTCLRAYRRSRLITRALLHGGVVVGKPGGRAAGRVAAVAVAASSNRAGSRISEQWRTTDFCGHTHTLERRALSNANTPCLPRAG